MIYLDEVVVARGITAIRSVTERWPTEDGGTLAHNVARMQLSWRMFNS